MNLNIENINARPANVKQAADKTCKLLPRYACNSSPQNNNKFTYIAEINVRNLIIELLFEKSTKIRKPIVKNTTGVLSVFRIN